MRIFRELYFRGTPDNLNKFADEIGNYATGDWCFDPEVKRGMYKEYLYFKYLGDKVENATVSIYLGERLKTGELNVGNIVPLNKNQLSVDEYNAVLMLFYEEVVVPFGEQNHYLEISKPSDDIFDPLSVMSEEALRKLELFCNCANKSTGSSHPCDRERWLDFICQTIDDDRIVDSTILCDFLKDEDYWGKKAEGGIGSMGSSAWDEDSAFELMLEYEMISEAMQYYRDKGRG